MKPLKVFVIAGDFSGETYALEFLNAIKDRPVISRGIGGNLLAQNGVDILTYNNKLSVVGLIEVLKNIRFFKRIFDETYQDILNWQPDLILMVDFPGFNLHLVKKIAPLKIPVHYYVPPQLFAWGKKRINTLAKYVDTLYYFYDIETPFLTHPNLKIHQVQQPLVRKIHPCCPNFPIKKIALLPGSRKQELLQLIPIYEKLRKLLLSHNIKATYYIGQTHNQELANKLGVDNNMIENTPIANIEADYAVCCSGTATLELALRGIPLCVTYKMGVLSGWIIKMCLSTKWISLPNLILKEEILKEFTMGQCNALTLGEHILSQDAEHIKKQINGLERLRGKLSKSDQLTNVLAQYRPIIEECS